MVALGKVEEWSEVSQAFVTTAVREGKVLYENRRWSGRRLAPQSRKRFDERWWDL